MIVYCDMNAVQVDIDGVLEPVTVCPFLRSEGGWDGCMKENILSGK